MNFSAWKRSGRKKRRRKRKKKRRRRKRKKILTGKFEKNSIVSPRSGQVKFEIIFN